MGQKSFLAERADRIARNLEDDSMGMLHLLLTNADQYVETVITSDLEDGMNNSEFDRRIRSVTAPREHELLTVLGEMSKATPGEDAIQMRRWTKTRVAYVVDVDTANAVANTDWGNTVITITVGDSLEGMAALPTGSVDLIVTSPPYNLRNSTSKSWDTGKSAKWAAASIKTGYAAHNDNMPHHEYVQWQRDILTEGMRTLTNTGAIFYNHKWRVQEGVLL